MSLAWTVAAAATPRLDGPVVVVVNLVLAAIMFGVGLDIDLAEFRRAIRVPRGPAVGLVTQFLVLPAVAVAFLRVAGPAPGIALGVLVVCTCPGGTTSNIVTYLAGANVALSIAMTTVSTFLALALTPLNLTFWSRHLPSVDALDVALDPWGLVATLAFVVLLPVTVGATLQQRRPELAARLLHPMRLVAGAGMTVLVVGAFVANLSSLSRDLVPVLLTVAAVNALALGLGQVASRALRLPGRDRRAVTIEVGMQNTALALTIAAQFFADQPEVAIVAALWGLWHLVTGLGLARWWSRHPVPA